MDALMVSGILYTPIGDPKPLHAAFKHQKDQLQKHPLKFPLPVLGQDEGRLISNPGKITRIKQVWYNIDGREVPVYYVLGFIEDKTVIGEILESAHSKSNYRDYYNSWCAWLNNTEYSELVESPYTGRPEWTVTGGKFDRFDGAYVCSTPCLHYAHLFLPFMGNRANKTLVRKHWRSHNYSTMADVPKDKLKLFDKIGMDQDLFDDLFGGYKFKKDKLINYKNPTKYT